MVVFFAIKHLRISGLYIVWRVAGVYVWRCLFAIFARYINVIVRYLALGNGVFALDRGTATVAEPARLEATARRVEAEFADLGNSLINLVHLSETRYNGDPAFCEAAIRHAAQQAEHVNFDAAAARQSRWVRLHHCMQTPRDLAEAMVLLCVFVAAAVVCQRNIPNWASASSRLLSPWEFVPAVGKVGTIEVTPKNTEILIGAGQEITADIKNPSDAVYEAFIYVKPEDEEESSQPLVGEDNTGTTNSLCPRS